MFTNEQLVKITMEFNNSLTDQLLAQLILDIRKLKFPKIAKTYPQR